MYPSRFYRIKNFLDFFFRRKFVLKKNINFGSKNANFYFTNKLKNLNFISNMARFLNTSSKKF